MHLRLQDGSKIEITIKDVINIGLHDALKIIGIVEFCEARPSNFETMVNRVKLLASVCDEELTERDPELCMCVWNCRQALQARPMSIEEQRDLERSMVTDERAVAVLEEAGLLGWQERERRELEWKESDQNLADIF